MKNKNGFSAQAGLKRALALVICGALVGLDPVAYAWAAGAASLEGVEVIEDGVRVHMSRRTKFNTFTTSEPPRLVLELLDSEHNGSSEYLAGQGKVLKRVRSGQYQREPNLISRVVLYLRELTGYSADWDGPRLVVELVKDAVEEEPEPAAMVVEEELPEREAPPARTVAPPTVEKATLASMTRLPKSLDTKPSDELSRIAASKDVDSRGGAPSARRPRRAPANSMAKKNLKIRRDLLATLSTDPIDLEFDDMDIRDVLKLMATKARINMVYGPDVSGEISIQLEGVPFNEAFTTILSMQGLVANQVGENILRVMTPGTLASERAVAANQTRIIKLKYVQGADLLPSIEAVRNAEQRQGSVVVDAQTNSLIVTDTLAGIAAVERLLAELDIRPQQVLIEAKLVEVNLTNTFDVGIQWDALGTERGRFLGKDGRTFIGSPIALPDPFGVPLDGNSLVVPGSNATAGPVGASGRGTGISLPANNVFGALTFGRITNNYLLNATLTAAASQGKAKVLSDPKITTLNGRQASIDITTQIPYVTSNVASTGVATESVSYITTGIQLQVTPTVNADGRVTLTVQPNVSQPSSVAATAGTTGAPAVDARTANTTVMVQDGETIVIGGMITDSVNDSIAKIPFFGDIPILGHLFRKKSKSRTRVELLIFITTKIVQT